MSPYMVNYDSREFVRKKVNIWSGLIRNICGKFGVDPFLRRSSKCVSQSENRAAILDFIST